MDKQFKIKLSIVDRVYPLTVHSNQEESLRNAVKQIDKMIKQFEQSYSVRDKQDVLAMCALQFAAQLEQKKINNFQTTSEVETSLKRMIDLLDF